MRTGLRGHITALMPQEIILPRRGLTTTTSKVLQASLRNPRQHQLTPGDGFWDAERTLQEVKEAGYFNPTNAEQACLPQALQVSFLDSAVLPDHPAHSICIVSTDIFQDLLSVIVPDARGQKRNRRCRACLP